MLAPAVGVALLWAVFAGTHIGLATEPIRGALVRRGGELGFTALFYLVAAAAFATLVTFYAAHRFEGAAGLALGTMPALRWMLVIVIIVGVALMAAALAVYPALPAALFSQPIRAPRGIERITRHPFFAGLSLFALAHTVLATLMSGAVFFAGFAVLSAVGAWHQDRKLLARRGTAYTDYLASTSALPFAAIVSGRQRLVWRELPVTALSIGFGTAIALRTWHHAIFAQRGAWVISGVLGGALLVGLKAWRRSQHPAPPRAPHGQPAEVR